MTPEPDSLTSTVVAAGVAGATATLAGTYVLRRLSRGRLGTANAYNVAKVSVSGPIKRNRRRPSPFSGQNATLADDTVEQITQADEDESVEALLLELNTPGGEVLPSDDIRRAADEFAGPTIAYATDTCASGGYWIASGCDELWARDLSLVGSIGVIGSRPNAADLADKLGISYEQFTAGEYKDAGVPLREIEADEREYLQSIVDGYYEQFIETVSTGREMDPQAVRDTEARIYLGSDALELGLVDSLGTEDDVKARIGELLDTEPVIRAFEPSRSLRQRVGLAAERVAFAAGNGVASTVTGSDREIDITLR